MTGAKAEPEAKDDKNPLSAASHKQALIASLIVPPSADSPGLLFQDTTGVPYVIDAFDGAEGVPNVRRCIAIGSTEWDDLLQRQWWYRTKTPLNAQASREITAAVAAFARTPERPVHHVYRRVGEDASGNIVIDIGGDSGKVIVCTPSGWSIEDYADNAVWFQRSATPLPTPIAGSCIDLLRKHVNIASDEDFHLAIAWEIAALRPRGPYPITLITGEAGSAKTTLARRLRGLVDPDETDIRTWSEKPETIAINSTKQWVLAYDNMSSVRYQTSDMLSQMSTGGTYSARTLYSNTGETTISLQHPVILTSVADVVTKPDLMDRALLIELSPPAEGKYIPEEELDPAFEADAPLILGALLDAVCAALQNYPDIGRVRRVRLPRMADFAKWMVAASPALGWTDDYFLSIYADNRSKGTAVALESNPWTTTLTNIVKDYFTSNPDATEYTPEPDNFASLLTLKGATNSIGRPFNGRTLSVALKELAGSLRKEAGIDWRKAKRNGVRIYSFTLIGTPAPEPSNEPPNDDDDDDHVRPLTVSDEMEAIFEKG